MLPHLIFRKRDKRTELVAHSTDDVIFCDRFQHMNIRSPPTGLQFVKDIKVGDACNTVCNYKGYTYVGLDNGAIHRIDDPGNVTSEFIKLANPLISIRAHNDQLFILMYDRTYKIFVYDLNGSHILTLDHPDRNGHYCGNKISVVQNQLAIPDVTNKRITLYTPAGEVIRHIQCAEIADTCVSMCEFVDNSVIISCFHPAKVFKFNLTTGDILWTNFNFTQPCTVRCYGQYVFVSGEYIANTRISVINGDTGELYGDQYISLFLY